MKNLIIPRIVMSPVVTEDDDGAAGGDDPILDNDDDLDDDDNDDDLDGDDDDDDDDLDGDDDDGDDDDGGDDDDDDEGFGKGAQKRIRKLNEEKRTAQAEVKNLKKQLDDAKKLAGDDGKAILAAAEASGILPGLMTAAEAEAFQNLERLPAVIEHYRDWLDDHGQDDELDVGNGEAMTYGQVKKRVRQLEAQRTDLETRYGQRRGELQAQVRKIFETGLAAMKAGWTGKKTEKAGKPKKKIETRPTASVRPKIKATRAEDIEVNDEDSLEAFIAAENRKAKRK